MSDRDAQIEELIREFLRDPHANESQLVTDHPDLMPELGRQLTFCRMVQEAQDEAKADPNSISQATMSFDGTPVPQDRSDDSLQLRPGQTFGNYQIESKLGRGGMGTVYEAVDLDSQRRLALKLLTHKLGSPEARQRFLREGRLAAAINHPNSVYVYGAEEINGIPVISMELIPGGTLDDLLKKNGPLHYKEAVDYVLQIIDGLEAAANAGVLHRDIKPANCFVSPDGTAKIGDFGLSVSTAVRADTMLTQPGLIVGTPAFSSPEQLRGDNLDPRSDIYSLGVTLYVLLSGELPFKANNVVELLATVIEQPAPTLKTKSTDIPKSLADTVLRCMAKVPSRRFDDYDSLRDALLPFSSQAPSAARLSSRALAGMIDLLIASLLFTGWTEVTTISHGDVAGTCFWFFALLVYFALPEATFGASIGKYILGLEVIRASAHRLGALRTCARTALWLIPAILLFEFQLGLTYAGFYAVVLPMPGTFEWLFVTSRRRNGFAAIHDLITDARVVNVRRKLAERKSEVSSRRPVELEGGEYKLGPYLASKTVSRDDEAELLLGHDPLLLRHVWLRVRTVHAPDPTRCFRNISRPGRLRWIGGGSTGGKLWDAYEFPTGSLLNLEINKPAWSTLGPWLYELAVELNAASMDGTIPSSLKISRVWITADGHAKLLDFDAIKNQAEDESEFSSPQEFLHHLAIEALVPDSIDRRKTLNSVGCRLPRDAFLTLNDLIKTDLKDVVLALRRSKSSTSRISRKRRAMLLLACCGGYLIFQALSIVGALIMQQESKAMLAIDGLGILRWERLTDVERQDLTTYLSSPMAVPKLLSEGSRYPYNDEWVKRTGEELMSQQKHHPPRPLASIDWERLETLFQNNRRGHFIYSASKAVLIWPFFTVLPMMIAVVVSRRGLATRAVEIEYVTRNGELASRGRLFWRCIVFGAPMTITLIWLMTMDIQGMPVRWFLPCPIGILALTFVSSLLPNRGLTDRIAGTYPVPQSTDSALLKETGR
jgi:uncharacterized RDD family membrane protein YckC